MDKVDKNYEKVEEYIRNNKEIENLGLIEIKNIWRGSRAMTYDTIPFINQVDQNVYLLTGGSYIGTHMASNFGKWMVELIMNKPFSNLPMIDNIPFDPTIKRLETLRKKYYFILVAILILLILVIIGIKNNKKNYSVNIKSRDS
jgi:glycine/D-amino acid oxidase-like deaminating enzyme